MLAPLNISTCTDTERKTVPMSDHTHYVVLSRGTNGNPYYEDTSEIRSEAQCVEFVRGCDAPLQVLSFNPVERWANDLSEDIALAVLRAELNDDGVVVSGGLLDFVEEHLGCQTVADAMRELAA